MATIKYDECEKKVSEEQAIKEEHQERMYHFRSEECKDNYIQEKFDFLNTD
ncbi:MAG TPA: hypothetical protein VHT73_05100 [Thermodesulfobacteriota bacterium]|nr:hypothetical protein [Thermodesulfobacteriota bacterium]